jgi:hypothetical protein
MLKPMAIALAAIMFAIPAQAQQPQYPDPGRSDRADTLLQDAPKPAAGQDQDADDNDPTRGWNRMKRGFYTGLIVGGFVGVLMAADCGHPECGPLITLAAGAGAGIGLTIDLLLVPERPNGPPTASRHEARAMPFTTGRRVAVGFRSSW